LAPVVERNRHHQFDFLPVTEAATGPMKIVGLLEVALYKRSATTDALVGEVMRPLSEENLIGADASILAFVRDADRRKCRLVVSGHEIGGLISLSDLQRLPVRAALFGLVTYFEILMASAIRWEFDGSEGWLEYVSEDRQRGLREKLEKAQAADGLVDPLLFTQFGDKKSILRRSTYLETSRGEFERELDKIQSLRDDLAHANDYAASPEAAKKTCETVRLIDKWSEHFSRWLRDPPPPSSWPHGAPAKTQAVSS
jgi:hypothetical protein